MYQSSLPSDLDKNTGFYETAPTYVKSNPKPKTTLRKRNFTVAALMLVATVYIFNSSSSSPASTPSVVNVEPQLASASSSLMGMRVPVAVGPKQLSRNRQHRVAAHVQHQAGLVTHDF